MIIQSQKKKKHAKFLYIYKKKNKKRTFQSGLLSHCLSQPYLTFWANKTSIDINKSCFLSFTIAKIPWWQQRKDNIYNSNCMFSFALFIIYIYIQYIHTVYMLTVYKYKFLSQNTLYFTKNKDWRGIEKNNYAKFIYIQYVYIYII